MIRAKRRGINNIAFAALLRALNERPRTRRELCEIVGVTDGTLGRWMALLAAQRLVYVDSWRRAGPTGLVALWCWGYMRDSEPKPPPATVAQHCRRYRARKAAAQERARL